jgi:hypothetical protein
VNRQYIFEGRTKISTFLCGPLIDFYQARKSYWSWNNKPIGIKNSSNEPVGKKEGAKYIIWKRFPIHMFSLNRVENDKKDSSFSKFKLVEILM